MTRRGGEAGNLSETTKNMKAPSLCCNVFINILRFPDTFLVNRSDSVLPLQAYRYKTGASGNYIT